VSRDKKPGDSLVLVVTAPNEPIALMWAEILHTEGIGCVIKRTDPTGLVYLQSVMVPCEIHVLASHAEKALEILSPPIDEGLEHDEGEQD
jgi:hypothetical protein